MPLFAVIKALGAGFANNATPPASLNTMAQQVVMEWYQFMILDGKGYQVRAGTITTPLVGGVPLANSAAEFCVDAATTGTTIIPVAQFIAVRLGTGTLHEYATKSVATVSSGGAAFVPLPLKSDGIAAVTTARVAAPAGVTVTAELATTTLRHWSYSNPVAAGAGNDVNFPNWAPAQTGAPVLVGPRCLYTQISATGTGPSYYANLDYLEMNSSLVNPS